MMMTGKPAFRYNLLAKELQLSISDNSFWLKVLGFVGKGFMLGAGTLPENEIPEKHKAITGRHAYAILDAFEFDGNRLVKLKDPRGMTNWDGEWSVDSAKWNSRIKEKVAQRAKESEEALRRRLAALDNEQRTNIFTTPKSLFVKGSTLFVSWEEFLRCFEVIFVSISFDETWDMAKLRGNWKANRASTHERLKTDPQYFFSVPEEVEVFCLLSNLVPISSKKLPKIGFEIYRYNGKLVGEDGNMPKLVAIGRYSTERVISLNCTLKKGQYLILISSCHSNESGSFEFSMWYPVGRKNWKLELHKM
eukprot:TRINITY_DN9021_c0_g1_i1.p1 TRINITY_DN9021_c0_g1~~TRINITY_DN9021_c0_g1_i1.p1  ORF type:complete len:306 (-),score=114.26 TRINITY_DN9021_c0_g1_i1:98-1015(-)